MVAAVSDAFPSMSGEHGGENYLVLLARLHAVLKPRSRLEIGVRNGASPQLAACAAIAIDPAIALRDGFLGARPVGAVLTDRHFEFTDAMHRLPGEDSDPLAIRARFTAVPARALATAEYIADFWLAP